MADKKGIKNMNVGASSGVVALGLTVLGAILFFASYSTGYYIFGQMKSGMITALIVVAFLAEAALLFFSVKSSRSMFATLLPFIITALLGAAAMLIVGDRVEGIGNCIVTDYDSGHGGEEAIFMSLVGAVCLLTAMVYNIIGAFSETGSQPAGHKKTLVMIFSGVGLGVAALIATVMLTGGLKTGTSGGGTSAGGDMMSGTYEISYNQNNNNLDSLPKYQFLSATMGGLAKMDARFYIDITLTLDGKGAYSLVSDAYVFDSGKRVEIGDPSGLALIYKTTSEGTYTDNGDGTVSTSDASHVLFELATDTYSEQMKSMMALDVLGTDDDGTYDSAEYPVVLTFVPATTWTLADGAIVSYGKGGSLAGEYTISYNQNNGNLEGLPDYQFLSASMGGLAKMDARFYIDIALTLDGQGGYSLTSDAYVFDSGKRVEIGDPSGLALIYKTTSEGSYTENEDGTVTTAAADHVKLELATDTYSEQMKSMMKLDVLGTDEDGEYDSADYPVMLDYVPETVWTLDTGSKAIVSYKRAGEEEAAQEGTEEAAATTAEALTVTSDDGGTVMVFNPDGTYVFKFESYGIEDPGTWTYEGGKLTITNANGAAVEAEGDPLKFHYVSAVNEQLGGDYTVNAADLAFEGGEAASAAEPLTVTSDDGGTVMVFNPDGTYVFKFESYGIEDLGTWTYEGGKLTVTNANGAVVEAEGDPLKFHYVSAVNEQLAGDYTVNAADLAG